MSPGMPLIQAPPVLEISHLMEEGYSAQAERRGSSPSVESNYSETSSRDSSLSTSNVVKNQNRVPATNIPGEWTLARQDSALNMYGMSTYMPMISSPLNPTLLHSTHSSLSVTGEPEAGASAARSGLTDLVVRSQSSTNTLELKKVVLSPAHQLSRQNYPPNFHAEADMSRQGVRRNSNDLGRDYSRYPRSIYTLSRPSSLEKLDIYSVQKPLLRTAARNLLSDSQANNKQSGYPDDSIGAFNPYLAGDAGFILYMDEIEADDKFHMPEDGDDVVYKPKLREYFEPKQIVSAIGGVFLILGLLCVFIILPILTFHTKLFLPTTFSDYPAGTSPAWAHVNNNTYSLLKNARTSLVDPDTPQIAKTRKSTFDGSTLNLVFSDEFNKNNRTFYPGDDPYWTAPDMWYGATQDMEWYDPDAVTTRDGTLQLKLDAFPNHGLQYRSGMLNSWNQLCFKGGVFEVSVSLAGPSGVPGLWPGVWTMGNLGRPGYLSTTDGVWPYTYNSCDLGITPNQSSPDGLSHLPGQKLSSCTCKGSEHPSAGTGRGAPEIDILEGSVDPNNRIGVVTQSFQVAPFDVFYRPNAEFMAIPNYDTTQMNSYCGGPFQQAVSGTTLVNNNWYDGLQYQKYAFEYIPGTSNGKIAWFVGEDPTFIMDGRAIGPNGNVAARQVSQEPMSIILNLGISGSWSEILIGDLKFPTIMHIDYVRIYQKPGQVSVTCDPPGYPTTDYIKEHPAAYLNPNFTVCSFSFLEELKPQLKVLQKWEQTGYSWPKNQFTGC
jgi:beta-glucanase (GH16 family)